jgi:hypothetical protein
MYHPRLSEALAVVSCVDPDAYTTGNVNDDVIDMSKHARVMFIVMAGTLASGASLDFTVYCDTASGGAFSTAVTGKSITALTNAGTDSDKQAIIEVTAEEVAAEGDGMRYIRGTMALTGGNADAGVVAIADHSRYSPASELDLTSVDEIVA